MERKIFFREVRQPHILKCGLSGRAYVFVCGSPFSQLDFRVLFAALHDRFVYGVVVVGSFGECDMNPSKKSRRSILVCHYCTIKNIVCLLLYKNMFRTLGFCVKWTNSQNESTKIGKGVERRVFFERVSSSIHDIQKFLRRTLVDLYTIVFHKKSLFRTPQHNQRSQSNWKVRDLSLSLKLLNYKTISMHCFK